MLAIFDDPAAIAASVTAPAWAQGKPIRIIVGYPAGSSPDVQARLIAEPLARALGQSVVVDNRPGAGTMIGTEHHCVVIGLTSAEPITALMPLLRMTVGQ